MHTATRKLAAIAILVAGSCTTAMNWRFSYQLGASAADSTILATFSVALDVAKWLMLPFATLAWRKHRPRAVAAFAIWFVATVYSFTAAIGFAALSRETVAAEREAQVDLQNTLQLMRQSPRWQSSAACSDATTMLSREFCAHYAEVEAKLNGTASDADPQSVLFARMSGFSPETVRTALSVFLAIACEVISALGFLAIMINSPAPATKAPAKTWTPPKWDPATASNKKNGTAIQAVRTTT